MKRLIIILGLIIASVSTAQAQYAYPSELTSRGSKIIADGQKLTTDQAVELFTEFGGAQYGEDYLSNRKGYRTGLTLTFTGPVTFAVGGAAYVIGGLMTLDKDLSPISYITCYTGAVMAVSGAVMTVTGIPTACIYWNRIKKSTKEYNAADSKPAVTFSPASSGFGIAMNF
jgi:lysozyme family protein